MPTPNTRLRSQREAVPLSQAELAERVGVAEVTVRRWEAGLRPQPAHLRRLCEVLGASPAELGYRLGEDSDPTGVAEDVLAGGLPDVLVLDTRSFLEALGIAGCPRPPAWLGSDYDAPSCEAPGWHRAPIPHELSAGLHYHEGIEGATASLSALVEADLEDHDRTMPFSIAALARASRDWLVDLHRRPSSRKELPADPRAQAIRDTFRAFQELDARYGGGHTRLALVQHLSAMVLPELHIGSSDVRGAGAELLYLAGLMAFDDGALGLAERYLIQALRFAEEGGTRTFAANVVAAMSHLAVFAGHGEEAVRLAEAGLTGISRGENLAVRMRLLTMQARGRAMIGDSAGCTADLSAAEGALQETRSDTGADWARFLNWAYLAGEMSQCFRDLHQEKLAERYALESIEASSSRGRRRVLSQATLAASYLQRGELEGACSAGGEALDLLGRGVRSTRAVHEIRCLARGLAPHVAHSEVRVLRDRVSEQLG